MTYFNEPSYAFTTKFFRWDLPSVAKFKPIVFKHFRDYCLVNDKTAKKYLVYVPPVKNWADSSYIIVPPLFKVTDLTGNLKNYGWTPDSGDDIFFGQDLLERAGSAPTD